MIPSNYVKVTPAPSSSSSSDRRRLSKKVLSKARASSNKNKSSAKSKSQAEAADFYNPTLRRETDVESPAAQNPSSATSNRERENREVPSLS